tara:strand:+ start:2984 stop:3133 length:150 start_codon:yes stop_codon:yes gene_type:complete
MSKKALTVKKQRAEMTVPMSVLLSAVPEHQKNFIASESNLQNTSCANAP